MDLERLERDALPGAFSRFDMEVVLPEVAKLRPGQTYLEVGVDKGRSLALAREAAVVGVDVFGVDLRADPKIPQTYFIQGDSTKLDFDREIDVLFIDGNHTYEGCKGDIDNWYPHMAKGGVMLFHDADETSPGVVQAIEEFIKENNLKAWYSPNQRCSMARIRL